MHIIITIITVKGEGMQIYRTENNESIYDIARKYEVSPIKIAEDNELEIRGRLPRGREILVLTPSRTYNVRSEDTLCRIAERFKTTKEALLRLNPELQGRDKIYSGQLLTIKESTQSYGMISTNGYLYPSTSREKLTSVIPYLSYVTVCSAVYKDSYVHNIRPSEDTVSYIKGCGRAPILRVYMTELPKKNEYNDFASSIALLAKNGGFFGVTLSSLNSLSQDEERLSSLVLTARRELIENDLLLFTEGDLGGVTSYMDYSDAGILTYDKIHLSDPPSFDSGEKEALTKFADNGESCRAFIEISSFAYSGGKHIEKRDALRICDRKHADLEYDAERKLERASYGKHKIREIVFESLENTKAKLELVSELGFMGISFDIGRICTADLIAAASMFDVIGCPIMTPKVCNQDI